MPAGSTPGPTQIIKMLELPPAEAARRAKEIGAAEAQRGQRAGVNPFPVFLMVILFFVVISSIARRAGGRRYKGRRRGGIDPLVILWGLDAISRSGRRRWLAAAAAAALAAAAAVSRAAAGRSAAAARRGDGDAQPQRTRTMRKVSAAIAAAEANSDGEIVAIASDQSDAYHDVGLHYAVLAAFAVLALFAAAPGLLMWWHDLFVGWARRAEPARDADAGCCC